MLAGPVDRRNVDLLTAALVGNVGDPLAVGRIHGVLVARRSVGDLREIPFLDRRRKDLAVDRKGDAASGGLERVVIDLGGERADLARVVLRFRRDVELDRRGGTAGYVELPDAEVVLEQDDLAVGADRRPSDVTGLEGRHLLGGAPLLRHAPDVCQAASLAIAHEVDEPVAAPHRPAVESLEIGDIVELLRRDVHHSDVGLVGAAVVLAPVDLSVTIDGELRTVGGVSRP
ncbi:MAG: hypothetical protein L0221_17500, partial [Chloroflexi bacterium]|nr:hypothetical protein [Chloroflexota bacterium]